MAKQLGAIQFRGKLGEIVGAKKAANQTSNTLRVRQRVIANPKTTLQATQRMKMTPACNFYRALRHILNHSWQGVQYEGPSHARFMKLALSKVDGYPYVAKGSVNPVPGDYQISQGGLAPVSVVFDTDNIYFGINFGSADITNDSTIGFISTQMLANNNALAEGDQLTFILVIGNPGYYFIYRTSRFVIDTKSSATFAEWITAEWPSGIDSLSVGVQGEDTNKVFTMDAGNIAAAAVIVSRPPVGKSTAWQRSNTFLTVNEDVKLYYGSDSALSAAVQSYKDSATTYDSEWYLNQGTSSEQGSSSNSVISIQTSIGAVACLKLSGSNTPRVILHQYTGSVQTAYGRWFAFENRGGNYLRMIDDANYETAEDAATALGISSYITLADFVNYMPDWQAETTVSGGQQGGGTGGSVEEQP